MALRTFAENANVLSYCQEDTDSHLGTTRGTSLRMVQTPRKAQQREGNKRVLDDILSCRIKLHLKPVSLWTSHSCEPINFLYCLNKFELGFLLLEIKCIKKILEENANSNYL